MSVSAKSIEADYLVIGAGAMGMAFTDTLITESEARVVIVDRAHRPGIHWDAAAVIRHSPAVGLLRCQLKGVG